MQDREFEKQVRQKMQELHFAPNTDVWARVQADIRKKKRRRPLIIFFLLAGLLVGTAVLYFGVNWNKGQVAGTSEQVINNNDNSSNSNNNSNQAINKQNETAVIENKTGKSKTQNKTITITDNNISKEPTAKKAISKNQSIKQQQSSTMDSVFVVNSYNHISKNKKDTEQNDDPSLNEMLKGNSSWLHITKQPSFDIANPKPSISFDSAHVLPLKSQENKQPIDSLAKKPFGAKANNNKKKSWELGASAGAGYVNATNELSLAKSFDALFSNGPRRDSSYFSPQVKGGPAFNIGGYASKPISKRITFKAGLNYEYYSTTMQVGSFVDSAKAVNQATGNLTMVDAYYRSGDQNKYTNAYHFISLPVSIQWRLNRNTKRSIIWENGVNIARLIKTNALQYDPITRSYYKDESAQNKTQWMGTSSILFRFLTKTNRHIYAGPQVQYAFTNLVKDADNKHLRYAGLKIMTSLNKK